jgi:hypothetical protein
MLAPIPAVNGAVTVSRDAEDVSTRRKNGSAVEVVGPETNDAVTDIESYAAPARNASVAVAEVAVAVSAVVCAAVVDETVNESAFTTALEGATDRTPRPKAATATSAMRLKVVFVDMCFLSIVDPRNFRRSAWASNALS